MKEENRELIASSPDPDEINLLDYWRVIWKRRWLIGGLFVSAVLAAMIVSLLQPKIYESTATLLPSLESGQGGGLRSFIAATGVMQGLSIALPGTPATPTDLFVAMLESRIMAEEVIRKLDLKKRYNSKTMGSARATLNGRTTIKVSKEKILSITVEDTNPQWAADIANSYVAHLDLLNQTLKVSKASQNRAFVEKRLSENQVSLVKAEEAFKEFQIQNKTVAVDAQSAAMMQAAAQIQGQIMAQEVQIHMLSSYLSHDNPELARSESTLKGLKRQLSLMEIGKEGKGMLPGDRLHPAMITVPELALAYGRLLRDLKVQESLYTLLVSQYEQAKLEEARDTPTVQVLDPAIPAEQKSKPKIKLNMMIAGVLALFLGIFLAFFLEYLDRIRASQPTPTSP